MRWLADENFNGDLVREHRRRTSQIDLLRVKDVGLRSLDDVTVLAWAASEDRILLTHDVATLTAYAYQRIERGEHLPGVIEVLSEAALGRVIADISPDR